MEVVCKLHKAYVNYPNFIVVCISDLKKSIFLAGIYVPKLLMLFHISVPRRCCLVAFFQFLIWVGELVRCSACFVLTLHRNKMSPISAAQKKLGSFCPQDSENLHEATQRARTPISVFRGETNERRQCKARTLQRIQTSGRRPGQEILDRCSRNLHPRKKKTGSKS